MSGKPNKKGGKKFKRQKKFVSVKPTNVPEAKNEQRYAQVVKKLGGKHMEVKCSDNIVRRATIPGSFMKRVWMSPGDVILVEMSELNNKECYILYKYSIPECGVLKSKGAVKFDINKEDDNSDDDDDDDKEDIFDKLANIEVLADPTDTKKKDRLQKKIVSKENEVKRRLDRDTKDDHKPIDFSKI